MREKRLSRGAFMRSPGRYFNMVRSILNERAHKDAEIAALRERVRHLELSATEQGLLILLKAGE